MRKRRNLVLILLLNFSFISYAQKADETEVKRTIEAFFEAFHKKDTLAIRQVADTNLVLQTMGRDPQGQNRMRTDSFDQFLNSIASIPDSIQFREELLEFNIQVDGPMAHAWTPYKFWINDRLNHCGVNSFQLFNDGTIWKIIYLADTRRKEVCDP